DDRRSQPSLPRRHRSDRRAGVPDRPRARGRWAPARLRWARSRIARGGRRTPDGARRRRRLPRRRGASGGRARPRRRRRDRAAGRARPAAPPRPRSRRRRRRGGDAGAGAGAARAAPRAGSGARPAHEERGVSSTDWLLLAVVLVLFLASIWLAMAETAFVRMNRIRALTLEEEGSRRAGRLASMLERPEQTLNAVLLLVLVTQLTRATLLGGLL